MRAKPIMIQGTASSSGKSLITAALCRIFHQEAYLVAPFKAQNMSNNSFVTHDGFEMGRAQVVQAYSAGLEPDVRMNPVLIKPSSDIGAQVVLKGKPSFNVNANQWHQTRDLLRCTVRECYESLDSEYDIIVIEGAGSPAEINLKKNDIVNMGMARMADSPVIIVGDIDRGGVFASLVGTMQLLDADERLRVKGFIINKFRGDIGLLKPGLDELEKITGVPVLGVIPYINHAIDDEDGVTDRFDRRSFLSSDIDICIMRLPHISNFTDFIPLEAIPGVNLRWCDRLEKIGSPDLLIIPGTKATIADLQILKRNGLAEAVIDYAKNGGAILGICGGFQMLGQTIVDSFHTESINNMEKGLGLLDMETIFESSKHTVQSKVSVNEKCSWLFECADKLSVNGYEIHMGKSSYGPSSTPFTWTIDQSGQKSTNGVSDLTGNVLGTYLHGIFDNGIFVTSMVNSLRRKKNLAPLDKDIIDRKRVLLDDLDRLADICRKNLDMQRIYAILNKKQ